MSNFANSWQPATFPIHSHRSGDYRFEGTAEQAAAFVEAMRAKRDTYPHPDTTPWTAASGQWNYWQNMICRFQNGGKEDWQKIADRCDYQM